MDKAKLRLSHYLLLFALIALRNHMPLFGQLAAKTSNESSENTTVRNSNSSKVRVNILCLAQLSDEPMFRRETFGSDTTLPVTLPNEVDDADESVSWLGNARLEHVEVRIILQDTKFRPEFNLRKTFVTVLERLTASPVAKSRNNTSFDSSPPTIHLIVGPVYSEEAKVLALITPLYNLAIISGSVGSPMLADRSRYPYFFRTCSSDGDSPDVLGNVLSYFKYTQLNILYFDEGFVLDVKELLEPKFRARGFVIENSLILRQHDNASFFHAADTLRTAKSRVWLTFLSSNDRVNYELLCALSQYGQISGATHFGVAFGQATSDEAQWWKPPTLLSPAQAAGKVNKSASSTYLYADDCSADQLAAVLDGTVHLSRLATDYADRKADVINLRASEFKRKLQDAFDKNGFGARNFYTFLYFKFDAMTAAALALDRVEQKLRKSSSSLSQFRYNDSHVLDLVYDELSHMKFQGLTGEVRFAASGNRERAAWTIKQLQNSLGRFVTVGTCEIINSTAFKINITVPLVFPTSDGQKPSQFSVGTFWSDTNITLVLFAGGAILVIGGLLLYWFVRRRSAGEAMVRAALNNKQHWLLNSEEFKLDTTEWSAVRLTSSSSTSNQTMSLYSLKNPTIYSQSSDQFGSTQALNTATAGSMQSKPYQPYVFRGARVCLFLLRNPAANEKEAATTKTAIDHELVTQLLRTQDCCRQNDNLTRFIGIVPMVLEYEGLPLHYVVMAGPTTGSKGTLSDFIVRARAHGDVMDEACTFSMLKDLHTGLVEVHRHFGCHGRLSSAICMIDNRLTLRLSDYGFAQHRQASFFHVDAKYDHWLWTAPEVLADLLVDTEQSRQRSASCTKQQQIAAHPNDIPPQTEQMSWSACDVYSFGIIMSEIFSSWHPFADKLNSNVPLDLLLAIVKDPNQILDMIEDNWIGNEVPEDVQNVTMRCTNIDLKSRPSLADVGAALNTMMSARKLSDNLTEMLMQRLEMYATNLESVVEQRTVALVEEENKVRRLLYQILPPTVADALKNGQSVPPQTYDSVTIYFSDVVGFTTISAQSTPLQVIDLLNDLYNSFDKILSTFDVYKVETIGDAYMVVSGLPKPNDMQHVLHIARMSVALIDHITGNFCIRHLPEEQLKLRIGMHTGACAAGVVGFIMPRYCLFGDTVNTASRMESTSEALRIHASEETAKALQKLSGIDKRLGMDDFATEFNLTERGMVDIKGKGHMRTFWLSKNDGSTLHLF